MDHSSFLQALNHLLTFANSVNQQAKSYVPNKIASTFPKSPMVQQAVQKTLNPTPKQALMQSLGTGTMGEMNYVNSPIAGFNAGVDALTSKPMQGPPMTPSAGFDKLKTTIPTGQTIQMRGGLTVPSQSDPAALAYEQAMNSNPMNFNVMEALRKLHPGDNRFAVHIPFLPK